MGTASRIRSRWAKASGQPQKRSGFSGASISASNASWITGSYTADAEIRFNLQKLRDRCRDLERNNPYMRKFLQELEANVIGSEGVTLQSKIKDPDRTIAGALVTGKPDIFANNAVERAWIDWKRKENCTVSKTLNFHGIEKLVVRSVARDGEAFVRIVRGFDNPFKFALQLIEPDQIDHNFNKTLKFNEDGSARSEIRMGVELNEWKQPTGYWMRAPIANDWTWAQYGNTAQGNFIRIDASEMLHIFVRERVNQTRGVPWGASIIIRTEMLDGYAEAEVTSARAEACKGTVYYSDVNAEGGFTGDTADMMNGVINQPMEPGGSVVLPWGVKADQLDPKHPNGNYEAFRKAMIRDVATGLPGGTYSTIGSDYSDANYSSLRESKLVLNEVWMMLQQFFIGDLHEPIFEPWLEMSLLTQQVPLPLSKFDKFHSVEWTARRWQGVDPEKDKNTKEGMLRNGFTTRTKILAEQGMDFEETLDQLKQEEALIKAAGLEPLLLQNVGATTRITEAPAVTDDSEPDDPNDTAAAKPVKPTPP